MSNRALQAIALLGAALALPADAAAPVAVSPTSVTISAAKQTDLVNLTNQGDDPVRFQLKVEAWEQLPDGEAVLTASEDVLVFPPLLSLAPQETKKVRSAPRSRRGRSRKPIGCRRRSCPRASRVPPARCRC